jgi:hypothetical protein
MEVGKEKLALEWRVKIGNFGGNWNYRNRYFLKYF